MPLLLVLLIAAPANKHTTAVLPLQAKRVSPATVSVFDELLVDAVDRASGGNVIAPADINAMLGLERLKDVVGCDDVSCVAEISNALGAKTLVSGSVSLLGKEVILSATLIDVEKNQVLKRAQRRVLNDETLFAKEVDALVTELYGHALTQRNVRTETITVEADAETRAKRARMLKAGVITAGVGVAFAIASAIVFFTRPNAPRLKNDYAAFANASAGDGDARYSDLQQDISRANTAAVASGVLVGVGAGLIVSGVAVLLAAPSATRVMTRTVVGWMPLQGGGGLVLQGRF